MSWPAEIDVFLAIGELSLYVAYLDGWLARHRAWPWVTALIGLSVSMAWNIGHIQPEPGHLRFPVGFISWPLPRRMRAAPCCATPT